MTNLQHILESKATYRKKLAQKSVAEKLRIVEQLAKRTQAIRKARVLRKSTTVTIVPTSIDL